MFFKDQTARPMRSVRHSRKPLRDRRVEGEEGAVMTYCVYRVQGSGETKILPATVMAPDHFILVAQVDASSPEQALALLK